MELALVDRGASEEALCFFFDCDCFFVHAMDLRGTSKARRILPHSISRIATLRVRDATDI